MATYSDPIHPPWATSRRPTVRDGDLRVSDAERRAVADALSQHYAEGRLDETEFNERLDQAMSAKTRSDLAPLLADFPRSENEEVARRPRSTAKILLVVFALFLAASAAGVLVHPHIPVLLIVFGLFLLARRRHWHHRLFHQHPWPFHANPWHDSDRY